MTEKLIDQLRERYLITHAQEGLFSPGLNALRDMGVTSVDDERCKLIVSMCDVWCIRVDRIS